MIKGDHFQDHDFSITHSFLMITSLFDHAFIFIFSPSFLSLSSSFLFQLSALYQSRSRFRPLRPLFYFLDRDQIHFYQDHFLLKIKLQPHFHFHRSRKTPFLQKSKSSHKINLKKTTPTPPPSYSITNSITENIYIHIPL